jgi:hypothetical protein
MLLIAVSPAVLRPICLRNSRTAVSLHGHLYMPDLRRLHMLHRRHIAWSLWRDDDLWLRARLLVLLVLLVLCIGLGHWRVLLAGRSRYIHMRMTLRGLRLRISRGQLLLHVRVLWRISLVLVPIWLLLLRRVGYILPVVVCLWRPVLVVPWIHGGINLGWAVATSVTMSAALSGVVEV